MSQYILLRCIRIVATFYVVATMVFFILKLTPGTPLAQFISPTFTEREAEAIIKQFGLDQPLHIQYVRYLVSISRFEFGRSIRYRDRVSNLILAKIPNTLLLLLPTLFITYLLGIIWGMVAGYSRGSAFEIFSTVFVLLGRAAPTFWVGMVGIAVCCFKFKLFPSSGITSPGVLVSSPWHLFLIADYWRHLALPLLTFSFYLVGLPFLVMRSSVLTNIGSDFMLFYKSFGVPSRIIIWRLARNSILPVVTVIVIGIGYIFEGAPVIESVFSWPGIGLLLVDAVSARDYPLAQGCFLVLALSVIIMNALGDILYVLLDPRVSVRRRIEE